MVKALRHAGNLNLLGGRLCLDFANTVDWHASDHPREFLMSYSDLIMWSEHAGIVTKREAQRLLREAAFRPEDAARVFERAIDLREAIYRNFSSVAKGSQPDPHDLSILNLELSRALDHLQIAVAAGGFAWDWTNRDHALDQVLWQIARSAAELLTSKELERVRQCADTTDGCGWLFLDLSRNRSRRWCDMRDCGNRAKVREYLKRQRIR